MTDDPMRTTGWEQQRQRLEMIRDETHYQRERAHVVVRAAQEAKSHAHQAIDVTRRIVKRLPMRPRPREE